MLGIKTRKAAEPQILEISSVQFLLQGALNYSKMSDKASQKQQSRFVHVYLDSLWSWQVKQHRPAIERALVTMGSAGAHVAAAMLKRANAEFQKNSSDQEAVDQKKVWYSIAQSVNAKLAR